MAKEEVLEEKVYKHSDTVIFVCGYSKDFAGKKHMKEGSKHKLHVLHAKRLEKKGLGKIVS